jgi:hypothetical protein
LIVWGVIVTGLRECQCFERFSERYSGASTEVTRQIERVVIGGRWEASGYTTREQADRLGTEVGSDSRRWFLTAPEAAT